MPAQTLVIGSDTILYAQWIIAPCQPSGLDPTFGTGGKVSTNISSGGDTAFEMATQTDGKIVLAGSSYNGANYDFALARYNEDGSPDATFGTGGKLTTAILGADDVAYSVAVQADGRIVAAGSTNNGANNDIAIVRYNPNGTLDATFGTGGKVTTSVFNAADLAYSVALQLDGKIVAAGYSNNGTNNDFALVRYNVNGTLDTSFGTGGKVTTAVLGSSDEARSVAILPDGRIIAAGNNAISLGNNDFALVRYNVDGSLDFSLNGNGKVTTAILTFERCGSFDRSAAGRQGTAPQV